MKKQQPASGTVVSLESRRRRSSSPVVHHQQLFGGQDVTLPREASEQWRPYPQGDAPALFPLLDRRSVLIQVGSHLRECGPRKEYVLKSAHNDKSDPDDLSGQVASIIRVTARGVARTICRMGRGTTPVRIRADMAKRLRSARIVAGYSSQKQAAEALGITEDRYEKWESGRTAVPAQYVGPVCDLYSVDANYLYGVEAKPPSRKTA